MTIEEILWPADRVDHIGRHAVTPEEFEEVCFGNPLVFRSGPRAQTLSIMAKTMNKLPETDSITALAEFWQSHDLTEFEDVLVEVTEPVFQRTEPLSVILPAADLAALRARARQEHTPEQPWYPGGFTSGCTPVRRPCSASPNWGRRGGPRSLLSMTRSPARPAVKAPVFTTNSLVLAGDWRSAPGKGSAGARSRSRHSLQRCWPHRPMRRWRRHVGRGG